VPYADPNAMGAALVAAAADAGIRITLLDTCYLHGGIGVVPNDVQRRFSDRDASAWAARAAATIGLESASTRVGTAVHSVRAVDPHSLDAVHAFATEHDLVVHAHVSEQPKENEQCLAAYGMTPAALLADHSLLSERFTAVHATHLTDGDIALLGSTAVTACLCPTTERDLADGIGPAARLAAAGASLSIGTDSHAMVDPFEEMRAIELDERLASHERGNLTTTALLRAATTDGQRSIGWADAGAIAPGALADFVTVRLDTVRTAGIDADHALDMAVFAATAADVHHVVVGGRTIVSEGRHRSLDVAAELDAAIRAVHEVADR
jgi:formiminoglutamate deiminase